MSLRTLSSARERDATLSILTAVLHKPEFPVAAMQRERARMIAALRDEESRPGEIAEKAFYQALYGNQGYGLPAAGKAESLNRIKRDDLQSWHRSRYRAGDAVISIIGDMTRADAERLALRLAAGLPQGASAAAPAAFAGLAAHGKAPCPPIDAKPCVDRPGWHSAQ